MLEKLEDLRKRLITSGYSPTSEQYGICCHAMSYLGLPYLRTEELSANSIDCSTLTSQSHWEGALIGIPFVADGQRLAVSGRSIEDKSEAEPGDVFVRYESIQHAPDKTYNHVGLFLGHDIAGVGWVIESRGGKGVILTPAADFPPLGGIKRFTNSLAVSVGSEWENALKMARHVPKMGRLGAKQYLKNGLGRVPHKGLDVYVEAGTPVYAPISGMIKVVSSSREELEADIGLEIVSEKYPTLSVYMKHLKIDSHINSYVVQGDRLGIVVPPENSDVQYVDGLSEKQTHLHIETSFPESIFEGIKSFTSIGNSNFFNSLYLAKLGILDLPVKNI